MMDVFKYALQACAECDSSNSVEHIQPKSKVPVLKELNPREKAGILETIWKLEPEGSASF